MDCRGKNRSYVSFGNISCGSFDIARRFSDGGSLLAVAVSGMHDPVIRRALLPPPFASGLSFQDFELRRESKDSLAMRPSPVGCTLDYANSCWGQGRCLVNGLVAEVVALAVIAEALHRLRLFNEAADAVKAAATAAAACGHPATHCQVQPRRQ